MLRTGVFAGAVLLALLVAAVPALGAGATPGVSGAGPWHGPSVESSRVVAGPATSTIAPSACLVIPRTVPCAPGPDDAVVNLLSNSSDSGARFELNVQLPPDGTNPAGVVSSFWVGLWVTGAPCSVDGASYLRVTLYPPFSPAVTPTSSDWVAQVPVTDLAPAGSCDPLCQNASAQGTVGGVAACEDNIVVGGGWPSSPSVGRFAPGDVLTVAVWGDAGSPNATNVWVNDTSDPSESAHWQYGASSTFTGAPVAARFGASNAEGLGWATPEDVAFGISGCPSSGGASPCTTYDESVLNATGLPLVSNAQYWNATTSALEGFPTIATASSSGGCSGAPGLDGCSNFLSFGGTGVYPTLSVVPTATGSAWRLGSARGAVSTYGGTGAEFAASGGATALSAPVLEVTSSNGTAGNLHANVSVFDPRGAAEVRLGALWCSAGGPTYSEVQVPTSGTRSNVSLTLSLASDNGPIVYWLAERPAGSVWSTPVAENLTMTGGGSSCSVPAPASPWFGPANVTAVAGGYRLTWQENSTEVRGFEVVVGRPSGPNMTLFPGNVSSLTVTGLAPGTVGTVTVTALGVSGANTSATATPAAGPLAPLVATASIESGAVWHGAARVPMNVTIANGSPPYAIAATLDNGTTVTATTPNATATVLLPVTAGVGFEDVRLSVTDANGVAAEPLPLVVDIWTGPLAPTATVVAGDSVLGISWTPPISLVAPVVGYTLYLTSDPTLATTTVSRGTLNVSGTLEVWNTTNTSVALPWQDNVTAYVLVVPYDALSAGFASPAPLAAVPAPLAPGPILGTPGGPAPFEASLSTLVRTGTNDSIDEAIYSFPGFSFATANVTRVGPTLAYANATARIATTGIVPVFLHVSDAFGGTAIVSGAVYVSSGAAPAVTATANPSPTYVGTNVTFVATASGAGPFVFTWAFGDGSNGSGATAVHAYAALGTFTASVTVVDNGTGGSARFDVPETVYALPAVAISTSAGPNGTGSYDFHARLIGGSGGGTFVWAFGDGTTGTGAVVAHDYRTDGIFTVNVTGTDASLRSGSASVTVDVAFPSSTTPGGGGTFGTPVVVGLLAVALVGWGVAVVAIVRSRAPAGDEFDDDDE